MQLESSFKSQDSIHRKAYKVDNPLQAKRSSGGKTALSFPQLRQELNSFGVKGERSVSPYPELRFACTGISTFKTFGLILNASFEQVFNLLK